MASSAFKAMLARTRESKNLDTVIVGSDFLPEGEHDVFVQSVDTSKIADGKIGVVFKDANNKVYNDSILIMSKDGTEFGFGLRTLWSALLPDADVLGKLLEWAESSDHAWEVFTGMKCNVELEKGPGYEVRVEENAEDGTKKFAAWDRESNEKKTKDFATAKEAGDDAKAQGFKRSYLRRRKTRDTEAEANIAAFNSAYESKFAASAAGSESGEADAPAGPAVAAQV